MKKCPSLGIARAALIAGRLRGLFYAGDRSNEPYEIVELSTNLAYTKQSNIHRSLQAFHRPKNLSTIGT